MKQLSSIMEIIDKNAAIFGSELYKIVRLWK